MITNLEGKVAIVTGGGQGIGLGVSESLAKEGCIVVPVSRNINKNPKTVDSIKKLSAKSFSVSVDVSSYNSVAGMVNTVIEKFGQIDILVNNAGFYDAVSTLESSIDDWENIFRTNLYGAIYSSKLVAEQMKNKGIKGSIINISSIQSTKVDPGSTAYCTAKGAVDQLTRALAVDLAPYGIRVNGIAPGFVRTLLWGNYDDPENYLNSKDFVESYIEGGRIPLRRLGEPSDIGPLVAFLSSELSSYITGQIFTVDGGLTITF